MDHSKLLSATFNEANVGIIVVNDKGRIIHNNPYLEILFGYEKGELKELILEDLLPNKYKSGHVQHRNQYLKNPKPRAMGTHQELYGLKKDGSKFPVEISLSYTTIDDQLLAIGYVTDDTNQKTLFNQLKENKARLDEAQSLAHLGNFEIEWASSKVTWSSEMFRIFELEPDLNESLKFEDIFKYVHPDDKTYVTNDTNEIIKNKTGSEIDFRIITTKGTLKYIHGKRNVKLDKEGNVLSLIGVLQDITPLRLVEVDLNEKISKIKQVEVELLRLNEALEIKVEERTSELEETVNRLLSTNAKLETSELQLKESLNKEIELNELKSRFVSMASHEFRTPLSTILSSASLISRYVKEEHNEKRQKHIDRIKSSVNNLTGILNDFLSLSKIEEGKEKIVLENIPLNALCVEIHDETRGLFKTGQELIHDIDLESVIRSDRRILKNILFNLISNAIKYSPENGVIRCVAIVEKNQMVIKIKDSGIGIPQEEQKHIFSRFFRASNVENIQGTGLGLNIVKRYTELLGGSIRFESKQSEGTTFILTLPI